MLLRVEHAGASHEAASAPLRCPDEIIANTTGDVHAFRHNGDDRAFTSSAPAAGDDRSVQSDRSCASTMEPTALDSENLLGDLFDINDFMGETLCTQSSSLEDLLTLSDQGHDDATLAAARRLLRESHHPERPRLVAIEVQKGLRAEGGASARTSQQESAHDPALFPAHGAAAQAGHNIAMLHEVASAGRKRPAETTRKAQGKSSKQKNAAT